MELSNEVDNQHSKSYEALSDFYKQLMSVATEMSDLLTAEERRAADMTKSLMENVENHENMLKVQHNIWDKSKAALLQADADIQTLLSMNIEHNDRRVIQSKIQTQFLASRLHLRQHDTVLSDDFK